jgi:hypothetical protein
MTDDFDISQIIEDADEELPGGVEVTTPSGAIITVMNQSEADYYDQVHQRYLLDNKFKNVSDILELDRILVMELMCYRWGIWILAEEDYFGRKINPTEVQKSIETYSREIRGIKKDLGSFGEIVTEKTVLLKLEKFSHLKSVLHLKLKNQFLKF